MELHFFFFFLQVCSVLDSLEREYKREDDMLQKHLSSGDVDKVTLITQLISKHQEQKEAFLKACTLARRTAETFLKYSNRSLQFFSQPTSPQSTFKGPEAKVKGNFKKRLTAASLVVAFFCKLLDVQSNFHQLEGRGREGHEEGGL